VHVTRVLHTLHTHTTHYYTYWLVVGGRRLCAAARGKEQGAPENKEHRTQRQRHKQEASRGRAAGQCRMRHAMQKRGGKAGLRAVGMRALLFIEQSP
jgi:hypothetical protein